MKSHVALPLFKKKTNLCPVSERPRSNYILKGNLQCQIQGNGDFLETLSASRNLDPEFLCINRFNDIASIEGKEQRVTASAVCLLSCLSTFQANTSSLSVFCKVFI